MSNETERVAFKAKFRTTTDVREILERNSFTNAITEQMWRGFQAGAAWRRAQAQSAPADLRQIHSLILNALDRDAAEGKSARGEMAQELRAALAAQGEK